MSTPLYFCDLKKMFFSKALSSMLPTHVECLIGPCLAHLSHTNPNANMPFEGKSIFSGQNH